jgi:NTE family protein
MERGLPCLTLRMATGELRIGLALGGGGAAALSYIGVLEELDAAGVHAQCVAGTSAGAIVGAAYSAGKLSELRDVLTSLTRGRMFKLFDPTWGRGGLMNGRRGMDLVSPMLCGEIEEFPRRFAAVATDLDSGGEVVLDGGAVADAVRASIAIPGVFCPAIVRGRVLVDGGLVNPIPVSVARRIGADFVIAVSILRVGRMANELAESLRDQDDGGCNHAEATVDATSGEEAAGERSCRLGVLDVLSKGSAVVQAHIAAARLRDDPPDAMLVPRSEHIGIFELMRCAEAIELGREAAQRAMPALKASIERSRRIRSTPRRLFAIPSRRRAV